MYINSLYVKNYRTLEELDLSFSKGYTAICGKNNSGKSNIIRAMRLLFDQSRQSFPFGDIIDLTYKSDLCAWKKDSTEDDVIVFKCTITLTRIDDEGIVTFIENLDPKHTRLEKDEESIDVQINIEYSKINNNGSRVISVNNYRIEEQTVSDAIFDKLRKTLHFHNSTMSGVRLLFTPTETLHGLFSQIPTVNKLALNRKAEALKKEILKLFKNHESEMQSMLGRLEDRFEVKLNTPEFDYENYPYGISLGFKDFNIPLDDWGSGTRNQTLILKGIFDAKAKKSSPAISERIIPIVVVEEPESFLHPKAQSQFGEVLQSLSEEFGIQVIITTHSPYLLSHREATSNILLERHWDKKNNRLGASSKIEISEDNWMKPFELALGVPSTEIAEFKSAIFSKQNLLIMVEGAIDKSYLEACRDQIHGRKALTNEGEIYEYNGKGNLGNTVLLKFIRDRYDKVIVTCDLDAENEVKTKLEALGFQKDKDFFVIGINEPGKRCIEGLVPDSIKRLVYQNNIPLNDASHSDDNKEAKEAKQKLKKLILEEFLVKAKVENGDYDKFYKLCAKINSAIKKCNTLQ